MSSFLFQNYLQNCYKGVLHLQNFKLLNFFFQVRVLIDEAITKNDQALLVAEKTRSNALREVGNHLHESVPVDDDEEHNKVERTHGDCTYRTKYSHVDLICMIDGEFSEKN